MYLSGGAIYIVHNDLIGMFYYGYYDYLGSLIALTNEAGTVVERYAYDPWGKRRNPDDWTQADNRDSRLVNRGYTGHEHIDQFGIINMNGRVYDPLTASFFSPDPYVQAPDNWLNYNRYSYCMGNPFRYTDPSGCLFKEIFGFFGLIGTIVSYPLQLIGNLISGQGFGEAAKNAWRYSPAVSMWNVGQSLDNKIFGGPGGEKNGIVGQSSSSDRMLYTPTVGPEKSNYYQFDDLKSMADFMWETSNKKEVDVEIVGYVLKDEEGNTYYYVLDWTGNTRSSGNVPYYTSSDPSDQRAKLDGKYIVALIHTHPSSNYAEKGMYDGSSYNDYNIALNMGVPVYSIGPTSISVITSKSEHTTKEAFDELAKNYYGFSKETEKRRKANPFYWAETKSWLENPSITTAW